MSLIQVPLKLFSHAKPCFHKYLFQYKIVDRSFTLATQHLIHSRLLSLLHTMNDNETSVRDSPPRQGTDERSDSPVVREVFSMFKSYLEDKLEEKGKQLDSKSRTEKQVAVMKYKGNQKQFEHNARLEAVFDKMKTEYQPDNNAVEKLVEEGKENI